jgi:hypothetical protein
VVSVASFGRGRGKGTLASLPAGIASGVAASGASVAWAVDGAKFRNIGLCTWAAPGLIGAKCADWVAGGGADTSDGEALAVGNTGAAAAAGACAGRTAGSAAGTGLVANVAAAVLTWAC